VGGCGIGGSSRRANDAVLESVDSMVAVLMFCCSIGKQLRVHREVRFTLGIVIVRLKWDLKI
jgi:hypothetical protein